MLANLLEVQDVYADAAVTDETNRLLFLSVWGRDTSLQELLARLSLIYSEGGLTRLTLQWSDHKQAIRIEDANCLEKYSGRAAKESLLGDLVHCWLYDRLAVQPDRVNRRCLLLKHSNETSDSFTQRVWQAVQDMCSVPLLPSWHLVMQYFQQQGWITFYEGIQVSACLIELSHPDVEKVISQLVCEGELSLITLHKPLQPLYQQVI